MLEPGLEWMASMPSAATMLSELTDSSRRISEMVAAIKSYSQMDRVPVQHIDVTRRPSAGFQSLPLLLVVVAGGRAGTGAVAAVRAVGGARSGRVQGGSAERDA